MVMNMVDDSPTQDDESYFTAEPAEDEPTIETPAMVKMTISNGSSGKHNCVRYNCNAINFTHNYKYLLL